ncbi:MAG: hypothetical protein ABIP74_04955 [Candidatus Saccharimonas sp.]
MNSAAKIIVSIGSIAVIASAGLGGFLLATAKDGSSVTPTINSTSQTTTTAISAPTASPSAATETATNTTALATSGYKDGTYKANTSYRVPHGGSNSLSATITVSGGKITAVKTSDNYSDGESAMYVDSFESSVSSSAVGISLANATFSRIGGASLTTDAFDAVLDTIRTQAKA